MDKAVRTALDQAIAALEEAKSEVKSAETQLENLLSAIQIAPRAEKTSVSRAIESALTTLRSARTKVDDAENTIAAERKKDL
jgi:hypothetical protein